MAVRIPAHALRGARTGGRRLAVVAVALLLVPLLAVADGSAGQGDALVVKVSPHVCFEGGAVRTQVRFPRDAQNRALRVEVDGEGYFSSSTLQLDGEASPAVYERRWPDLPAGRYVVHVVILQATGESQAATAEFTVVDPRAQGPPE
jgi:hypothetical protein